MNYGSYSVIVSIQFSKVILMDEKIEVINYDDQGNIINPKQLIIKEKVIYELIKKYIEGESK